MLHVAWTHSQGLRKPIGGCPRASRSPLSSVKMPAAIGAAADVPPAIYRRTPQ
jgi:hypothetical protein